MRLKKKCKICITISRKPEIYFAPNVKKYYRFFCILFQMFDYSVLVPRVRWFGM